MTVLSSNNINYTNAHIDPELFMCEVEHALWESLCHAKSITDADQLLRHIVTDLSVKGHFFLDKCRVFIPTDYQTTRNRVALLTECAQILSKIADLSKLIPSKG